VAEHTKIFHSGRIPLFHGPPHEYNYQLRTHMSSRKASNSFFFSYQDVWTVHLEYIEVLLPGDISLTGGYGLG
jgi:hypothetical protein